MVSHRLGCLTLQSGPIEELLDSGKRHFSHVVPVNAEVFVLAHEDADYGLLLRSTLNIIDGRVLQHLVRLRHLTLAARRIVGADAIYSIAERCQRTGEGLFILGASREVNRRACARLRAQYPGLRIDGFAPPMGDDRRADGAEESLLRIRDFAPAYLGVCLGAPKQEFWIDAFREQLADAGVRLAIGLGGTADFVSGAKPRAPRFMQWAGLEWLFRCLWEPRRRWNRTLRMFRMPFYALLPASPRSGQEG